MAEKEKKLVKYKFGRKELNLSDYINNLGNNVLTFLNKLNWNSEQKEEFMNAYNQYMSGLQELLETDNGRFSADDFGNLTDNSGLLSSKDNDNIDPVGSEYYYNDKGERITTDDYNTLKSRKLKKFKTFDANLLVAAYFNEIGRMSKGIEPEKSEAKEKFDINKHGFLADWQRKNNPSGEKIDITPYLNMDSYDESTGKRDRKERLKYLSGELLNYLKNFEDIYDFEGTPYKSTDEYKQKLLRLINSMQNGWSEEDMIIANQAGIGGDFYNTFFTEEKDPSITEEQRHAEEKEKSEKIRQDAWRAEVDRRYDIYTKGNNSFTIDKPFYITVGNDYTDDLGKWDIHKWRDSFKANDPYYNLIASKKGNDVLQYLNSVLKNPYSSEFNRAMLYMINNNIATPMNDGRYYIRQESDSDNQSGLVYDPNRRVLYRTFLGDIPQEWDIIKNKFLIDYNPQGGASRYYKDGGLLNKLQIGGWIDVAGDYERSIQQSLNNKAKSNNKTIEELAADDRKIGTIFTDAEQTAANPDTNFTDIEYARIGSAVADIASTITAFVPGAGTVASAATGLGSTFLNAYADMRDDGVSGWQAFKNFGINLGMDIAGLIPGGGFASKTAKILRSVGKIIPKVALALGTMSAFNNKEGIMNSLNKAIESPSDMTVQDWQNMALAFSMIGGASTIAGAAYGKKAKKAKKELASATNNDKIALDIMLGGSKKTILFAGDDAKAIRLARESNDVDTVNNILKKYEGTKDAAIVTSYNLGVLKGNKWYKPIKLGDTGKGNMAIHDIITDSSGAYIQRGSWNGDTRVTRHNLPEIYGRSSQTVAATDKKVSQIKSDIIESLRDPSNRMKKRRDSIEQDLNKNSQEINDINSQLVGKKSEAELQRSIVDLQTLHSTPEYTNRLTDFGTKKTELLSYINQRNSILDTLDNHIRDPKTNPLPKGVTRKKLQQQINDLNNIITRKTSEVNSETQYFADNDVNALTRLQDELNLVTDLNKRLKRASSPRYEVLRLQLEKFDKGEKRSKEYNDFVAAHTTSDGKISWANPNGRPNTEMTKEEFNEILKNAGILFKKGGNLDLNKVHKFQNGGSWRKNIYNNLNAENTNDWDLFYNMDDILNSIKSMDSSKLVSALNNLESVKADFSTKEVNKRGYGLWNKAFNNTGLNTFFGYNEDKADYLGPTTWNRNALVQKLKELKNITTADGSINFNNGLWLISNSDVEDVLNPTVPKVKPAVTKVKPLDVTEENISGPSLTGFNVLSDILNNPTVTYALPRALYADKVNKRLTDMAVAGELAVLKNPFTFNRYVSGDLNALNAGQKAQAELNSRASKFFTSDPSLLLAMLLDAAYKGLEFLNYGKMLDNEAVKQSSELAMQQSKENALNEHETSEYDKLQLAQLASNINKHKMAYENKKHTIYDTLWKLFEFEAKQKLDENKAYTDYYTQQDISNKVATELGILDASLDPEGVKLYLLVNMGSLNPSDITDLTKYLAFIQAYNRAKELENEMLRESRGIPKSKYYTARTYKKPNNLYTLTYAESGKNGTKLKIAKLKARLKDVENFLKSIQKSLDRNEKRLDRLSKSMYRLSKK